MSKEKDNTIVTTEPQKVTLSKLIAESNLAKQRVDIYLQSIMDGSENTGVNYDLDDKLNLVEHKEK